MLSNAIKFTPAEGKVDIELKRADEHVEIEVSDTGIGIKPEFLPYVFDRFRQADATTTRTFGGLGLGLSIVRRLVELHGGTVRVASSGDGHGSTVSVRLPLMPAIARQRPRSSCA
ncbi:MAG: sensor histidine kinase [Burkholderiales bacterium]